ncbi:MAG: DMT family transporter [Alphaproteobacteria bacterium]|nr:DMT family transporter [Alphaproteobacteria bacterium]
MPENGSAPAAGTNQRITTLGIALLVTLTLIWGCSWPMMKICVGAISPWTFRTLTTLFPGTAVLIALMALGVNIRIPPRRLPWLALLSFVNVTSWMLLSAFALTLLPAGRSSIIAYTMPIWSVVLGAIFLHERISRRRVIGLALGLSGLAVLVGQDLGHLGVSPLGTGFMVLGAIFWAAGIVLMKLRPWNMPVWSFSGWQLTLGGLPIALGAIVLEDGSFHDFGWQEYGALAYVLLIAVICGNYLWFKIVSLMPAGIASIGTMAIPVVGVVSSLLLLGETVSWREIMALTLVVGALVSVLSPERAGR